MSEEPSKIILAQWEATIDSAVNEQQTFCNLDGSPVRRAGGARRSRLARAKELIEKRLRLAVVALRGDLDHYDEEDW